MENTKSNNFSLCTGMYKLLYVTHVLLSDVSLVQSWRSLKLDRVNNVM
jgi:hypothetical protein